MPLVCEVCREELWWDEPCLCCWAGGDGSDGEGGDQCIKLPDERVPVCGPVHNLLTNQDA